LDYEHQSGYEAVILVPDLFFMVPEGNRFIHAGFYRAPFGANN